MNKKIFFILGIFVLLSVGIFIGFSSKSTGEIISPYKGQELREIKSLSQEDIEGLLAGEGTPFGGMAKPAELNGYPGPRHVLDAYENEEFILTDPQKKQTEKIYEEMRTESIELGKQIIKTENSLDEMFSNKTINEELLKKMTAESSYLYSQLRETHLKAHLEMMEVLDEYQIERYNKLRGYSINEFSSKDPCENIPEGHDPEMWKAHNNCD